MSCVRTIVITAGVSSRVATIVLRTGPPGPAGVPGDAGLDGDPGPSAYETYLETTSDDPVLSQAEWAASRGAVASADISDSTTMGRSLLTAETASAARTELGIPDPPESKTATNDVVKSNQNGTLNDAAQNDAEMYGFAVDANSTYRVTIYFEYSSTATSAGIKIGVNFPSLAGNGAQRGGVATIPSGSIVNIPHVVGSLFQLTSPLGGTRVQITATIIARTGATGGVGDFRWAQLTSSAELTTRHAGSSVTFEKIA